MNYAWATLRHKWYVFLAGRRLKVPLWRLIIHDWHKFLPSEYMGYQRQFFGDKADQPGFAMAWLRHQNRGSHHWEFHILRSDHSKGASGAVNECLPMPEMDVREMLADWIGASKSYTGSWDITDWLVKNGPKMRLHPVTVKYIYKLLDILGYVVPKNIFKVQE